jgi:hypothetical protein
MSSSSSSSGYDMPIAAEELFVSWVVYEPDLTGFNTLIRNWYELQLASLELNHVVPDPVTFTQWANRFLATMLHVFLNEEYKMAGIPTDSPRKLLTSLVADGGLVPVYMVDLVREIARPMARSATVFIPALNLDFDGDAAFGGTGLSPAFSSWFCQFIDHEFLVPLITERLVPAPLVAFVGTEGVLVDNADIASERYKNCLALRQLHNGCRAYDLTHRPGFRKTARGTPLVPRNVRHPASVWELRDRFDPCPPIDVAEDAGFFVPALQALQSSCVIDHHRLKRMTVVLHYESDPASMDAWVNRQRCAYGVTPSLPTVSDLHNQHRYGYIKGRRISVQPAFHPVEQALLPQPNRPYKKRNSKVGPKPSDRNSETAGDSRSRVIPPNAKGRSDRPSRDVEVSGRRDTRRK